MANTFRRYMSIGKDPPPGSTSVHEPMDITAIVGPAGVPAIQFTIGMNYCVLAPNQLRDLIHSCFYRIQGKDGYKSTDGVELKIVYGLESITKASRKEEKDRRKAVEQASRSK